MELNYKGCYGPKSTPNEVKKWVLQSVKNNIDRFEQGVPRTSLNIWGHPGCSKTSIIKQLQDIEIDFEGKKQKIEVISIPLAQIEEMGDVLGFPVEEIEMIKDNESVWVKSFNSIVDRYLDRGYEVKRKRTSYAPPSWVPTTPKPGVILFDDANRASQRILKGFMQLIQDYKTIAWDVPKGWTIVFTGNPDNHRNQVTSIDVAQLTRMRHMTLIVDAKEWAIWAENMGIDPRGINFVLRYPEMMIGSERTNPRTLTEFFLSLPQYTDLKEKEQLESCLREAATCLDEDTVSTFGVFVTRDAELIISPEMILEDVDSALGLIEKLIIGKSPRIDLVSITMERLTTYLLNDKYLPSNTHINNFKRWMLYDKMPKDIVFASIHTLVNHRWKFARQFVAGKEFLDMAIDMRKFD